MLQAAITYTLCCCSLYNSETSTSVVRINFILLYNLGIAVGFINWNWFHKIEQFCKRTLYVHFKSAKLRALCAPVPTCLACLRAPVPTCLVCLRLHLPCVLCVPTCSSVIAINTKNKSSITCFSYILWLFFVFFLWNKTVVDFCISLTRRKPLTGTMTNFVQ